MTKRTKKPTAKVYKALYEAATSYIDHLLVNIESMKLAVADRYENPIFCDVHGDLSESAALLFIQRRATELLNAAPPSPLYNVDEDYAGDLEQDPEAYLAFLQEEKASRLADIKAAHDEVPDNETPEEKERRIDAYNERHLAEVQVFAKESAFLWARVRLRWLHDVDYERRHAA
jgi:hypothetical protein